MLTEEQGAEAKVRLFDAQELPSNIKYAFPFLASDMTNSHQTALQRAVQVQSQVDIG